MSQYTARDHAFMQMMAEQAAERHRTPVATVTHPKGVIVPEDQLLTDNIRNDPNYVPYCGPCTPMQRMRRNETGFHCPTCGVKTNWDLTPYNGNINVQFDPQYVDPEWLVEHQRQVEGVKLHEALHEETYAEFKLRENEQRRRDWRGDEGKKNTSHHKCNKCNHSFFGKNSRKYCRVCQEGVTQHLAQSQALNSPLSRSRLTRRGH